MEIVFAAIGMVLFFKGPSKFQEKLTFESIFVYIKLVFLNNELFTFFLHAFLPRNLFLLLLIESSYIFPHISVNNRST